MEREKWDSLGFSESKSLFPSNDRTPNSVAKNQIFRFLNVGKVTRNKSPLDSIHQSQNLKVNKVNKEIEARKIFYNIIIWISYRLVTSTLQQVRMVKKLVSESLTIYFGMIAVELLFAYNIVVGFLLCLEKQPSAVIHEVAEISKKLEPTPKHTPSTASAAPSITAGLIKPEIPKPKLFEPSTKYLYKLKEYGTL